MTMHCSPVVDMNMILINLNMETVHRFYTHKNIILDTILFVLKMPGVVNRRFCVIFLCLQAVVLAVLVNS